MSTELLKAFRQVNLEHAASRNPSAESLTGRRRAAHETQFFHRLSPISRDVFFSEDHGFNGLAALADGANSWSLTEPLQYRAKDRKHVYFVKAMGSYFERQYGTHSLASTFISPLSIARSMQLMRWDDDNLPI
jgi:hypothetical protein